MLEPFWAVKTMCNLMCVALAAIMTVTVRGRGHSTLSAYSTYCVAPFVFSISVIASWNIIFQGSLSWNLPRGDKRQGPKIHPSLPCCCLLQWKTVMKEPVLSFWRTPEHSLKSTELLEICLKMEIYCLECGSTQVFKRSHTCMTYDMFTLENSLKVLCQITVSGWRTEGTFAEMKLRKI